MSTKAFGSMIGDQMSGDEFHQTDFSDNWNNLPWDNDILLVAHSEQRPVAKPNRDHTVCSQADLRTNICCECWVVIKCRFINFIANHSMSFIFFGSIVDHRSIWTAKLF